MRRSRRRLHQGNVDLDLETSQPQHDWTLIQTLKKRTPILFLFVVAYKSMPGMKTFKKKLKLRNAKCYFSSEYLTNIFCRLHFFFRRGE